MTKCYDNRLFIQLICKYRGSPAGPTAWHDVYLDNHAALTLYDVNFKVSIAPVSAPARLLVSGPDTAAAASAGHVWGQLSHDHQAKVPFVLSAQGSGPRFEVVGTAADWIRDMNAPLTGSPPQRYSRNCQYNVPVQ